jgi:ParB-like chromosome segregation protein Spo0J
MKGRSPVNTIIRPTADPKVEGILHEWNLRFDLVEAVEIASIVQVPEQQARAVAHRALPENVDRYYEHMKNGAQFPPIVLREPRIMLDGNTRVAAATKLGMQYFPAYVVQDISTAEMARALSAAINQLNGVALTNIEAQEIALEMLYGELKFPVGTVARYVGRSGAQITRWRKQADVMKHAERLGITEQAQAISANQREKLAGVQFDEPFRRLVDVVASSKPPNTELTALVKDIEKATSEQDAISAVEAAAAQWRPTGPTGRVVRNEKARRARMLIPQLLNLRAAELFDPEKAGDDRVMWEHLRDQVEDVLRAFVSHGAQ